MIDQMVLDTIDLARNAKSEREKRASEDADTAAQERSPVAFSLRKFARQVAESKLPESSSTNPEPTTKTAEDAQAALKGLTLLHRFTGGIHAV